MALLNEGPIKSSLKITLKAFQNTKNYYKHIGINNPEQNLMYLRYVAELSTAGSNLNHRFNVRD